MEQILGEGIVDLIATARTYRAEPDFMKKLRSNGKEVPTPCLRCNKCHGSHDGVAVCSVNPKDALNHRLPLLEKAPERAKKVAVIGGGPIGMRTACFAAERGHQVTLFEQEDHLGGKPGYYANLYPDKWNIKRYVDWLIGEVDRRGVSVQLGNAPTPEDLTAQGFEAVIACTGSHEKRPPIEGANDEGVYLNEDVYTGKVQPGQKVVIVGGGDVSTDTAMYLASTGRQVTVLTRRDQLMNKNQNYIHGPTMCNLIYLPDRNYGGYAACYTKYDTIHPVFHANTVKITPHSVTYVQDGQEHTLEADTVIVSGGYQPNAKAALAYSECTPEFYMAGDDRVDNNCLMHGNRSAYGRAIML
jgi:NADPH-dependent glutamate synthase beta subunit-like oxidoreductase